MSDSDRGAGLVDSENDQTSGKISSSPPEITNQQKATENPVDSQQEHHNSPENDSLVVVSDETAAMVPEGVEEKHHLVSEQENQEPKSHNNSPPQNETHSISDKPSHSPPISISTGTKESATQSENQSQTTTSPSLRHRRLDAKLDSIESSKTSTDTRLQMSALDKNPPHSEETLHQENQTNLTTEGSLERENALITASENYSSSELSPFLTLFHTNSYSITYNPLEQTFQYEILDLTPTDDGKAQHQSSSKSPIPLQNLYNCFFVLKTLEGQNISQLTMESSSPKDHHYATSTPCRISYRLPVDALRPQLEENSQDYERRRRQRQQHWINQLYTTSGASEPTTNPLHNVQTTRHSSAGVDNSLANFLDSPQFQQHLEAHLDFKLDLLLELTRKIMTIHSKYLLFLNLDPRLMWLILDDSSRSNLSNTSPTSVSQEAKFQLYLLDYSETSPFSKRCSFVQKKHHHSTASSLYLYNITNRDHITVQDDIYALGCLFLEICSGISVASLCANMKQLSQWHNTTNLDESTLECLSSKNPPELVTLVLKMMGKNQFSAAHSFKSMLRVLRSLKLIRRMYIDRALSKIPSSLLQDDDSSLDHIVNIPFRLLGRDPEIAQISKHLVINNPQSSPSHSTHHRVHSSVHNSKPTSSHCIIISGPEGIGKSTLVHTCALLKRHSIIFAHCSFFVQHKVSSASKPFAAIHRLMANLVSHADSNFSLEDIPNLNSRLMKAHRNTQYASEIQQQYVDAVVDFFHLFCNAHKRLVLFVDQAEYADEDSLHLLKDMVLSKDLSFVLLMAYDTSKISDNTLALSHPSSPASASESPSQLTTPTTTPKSPQSDGTIDFRSRLNSTSSSPHGSRPTSASRSNNGAYLLSFLELIKEKVPSLTTIELQALSQEHILELVHETTGVATKNMDEKVHSNFIEMSQGCPLLAHEILLLMKQSKYLHFNKKTFRWEASHKTEQKMSNLLNALGHHSSQHVSSAEQCVKQSLTKITPMIRYLLSTAANIGPHFTLKQFHTWYQLRSSMYHSRFDLHQAIKEGFLWEHSLMNGELLYTFNHEIFYRCSLKIFNGKKRAMIQEKLRNAMQQEDINPIQELGNKRAIQKMPVTLESAKPTTLPQEERISSQSESPKTDEKLSAHHLSSDSPRRTSELVISSPLPTLNTSVQSIDLTAPSPLSPTKEEEAEDHPTSPNYNTVQLTQHHDNVQNESTHSDSPIKDTTSTPRFGREDSNYNNLTIEVDHESTPFPLESAGSTPSVKSADSGSVRSREEEDQLKLNILFASEELSNSPSTPASRFPAPIRSPHSPFTDEKVPAARRRGRSASAILRTRVDWDSLGSSPSKQGTPTTGSSTDVSSQHHDYSAEAEKKNHRNNTSSRREEPDPSLVFGSSRGVDMGSPTIRRRSRSIALPFRGRTSSSGAKAAAREKEVSIVVSDETGKKVLSADEEEPSHDLSSGLGSSSSKHASPKVLPPVHTSPNPESQKTMQSPNASVSHTPNRNPSHLLSTPNNRNYTLSPIPSPVSSIQSHDTSSMHEDRSRKLPSTLLYQLSKRSMECECCVLHCTLLSIPTDYANDAENTFTYINDFLNSVCPAIEYNYGYVDKFQTTCIHGIFPPYKFDVTVSSLNAAIDMMYNVRDLCVQTQLPLQIGATIHMGQLKLGTIQYSTRVHASALGGPIDFSAILNQLSQRLKSPILITNRVYEIVIQLSDAMEQVSFRKLGRFVVNAMESTYQDPIELYELYDEDWDIPNLLRNRSTSYGEATWRNFHMHSEVCSHHRICDWYDNLFSKKLFTEALERLEQEIATFPRDHLLYFLCEACELYETLELPKSWRGEIRIDRDGSILPLGSPKPVVVRVPTPASPKRGMHALSKSPSRKAIPTSTRPQFVVGGRSASRAQKLDVASENGHSHNSGSEGSDIGKSKAEEDDRISILRRSISTYNVMPKGLGKLDHNASNGSLFSLASNMSDTGTIRQKRYKKEFRKVKQLLIHERTARERERQRFEAQMEEMHASSRGCFSWLMYQIFYRKRSKKRKIYAVSTAMERK